VPGIEKPIVANCIDLLLGRKKAGESVVMIGGGLVGCETALWLANQGKRVTIVEVLPEIAAGDMSHANQFMLLDLLRNKEVEFMTNTSLEAVTDEGVIVIDGNFTRKTIPCDTVALALGLAPERGLYESLRGESIEPYLIGDCKEPHNIMQAIWDGYHIASR
jgi:2-enoate reductase